MARLSRHSHRTNIVVAEPDLFNYQAGEPPSHLLTVLRVLDVCLSIAPYAQVTLIPSIL
jgi:hypothetical protein